MIDYDDDVEKWWRWKEYLKRSGEGDEWQHVRVSPAWQLCMDSTYKISWESTIFFSFKHA